MPTKKQQGGALDKNYYTEFKKEIFPLISDAIMYGAWCARQNSFEYEPKTEEFKKIFQQMQIKNIDNEIKELQQQKEFLRRVRNLK